MSDFKNLTELYKGVSARIKAEIDVVTEGMNIEDKSLGKAVGKRTEVAENEPTGLKDLNTVLDAHDTSVEDKLKEGKIGIGMRVNNSSTNPILLQKLKDNGVEPGFIYKNDWSLKDTISLSKNMIQRKALKSSIDLKKKILH